MLWNKLPVSSVTELATYVGQGQSITPGSSFSLAGVDIGNVATDRVVVVCVMATGATARTISGVKIAGNAATLATQNASFRKCTGIYYLAVPTGTTATIAVTFSGSIDEIFITTHALNGWGTVTLHDGGSATSTGDTVSVSGFDTPAGGLAIAAYVGDLLSVNVPFTDLDGVLSTAPASYRVSKSWRTASATGTTANAQTSVTPCDKSLSVASFS